MSNFYPRTKSDMGSFFVDKDGDVWQMKSYCSEPQIGMCRVRDGEWVEHVVGCPNMMEHGWVRLDPAEEVSRG